MNERGGDSLDGRVAIVTGAGQGIGRALAVGFAREGCAVVIAELNADNAAHVRTEVEGCGGRAVAITTDVSQPDSVDRMVAQTVDMFGCIDILVNNAGIFPISPVESMPEPEWDSVIGTNLVGAFLCTHAAVPYLLTRGYGRVISLASGRALEGAANGAHYAASKGGIIGFTRSLSLELAPHGITANVILPGITDTAQPRAHYASDEALYARGADIPLGRIGQPDDLVGPALFLASEAGRFVTGQTLVVNGGAIRW